MGKSDALDIRERVVSMVDSFRGPRRGTALLCQRECCDQAAASSRSERHCCMSLRQGRPRGSGKLSAYLSFLIAEVERKPDITMPELADKLDGTHGVRVPPSSLSRVLVAHGLTYKKALMASNAHAGRCRQPRR
nr:MULTISPECIES: hypothetical protein [Rhizobium]